MGGHLVRFVAHHQIEAAVRRCQQRLQFLVAGELVQPSDNEIPLRKPIAARRRTHAFAGENLERQVEAGAQFVLPLLGQAARAHHQTPPQIAAHDEFLHQQASHDGLAGAGIVGEQEAQRLARQHGLVDGGDLMRQRFHQRGVDGEQRIEKMRQADAKRFRHQSIGRTIAIEAPDARMLREPKTAFVLPIEHFFGDAAGGFSIGQREGVGAVPTRVQDGDGSTGRDASNRHVRR